MRTAHLDIYLLEKSRVTRRGEGEHNFHVLYELVHGTPIEMRKGLHLTQAPAGGGWAYLSSTADRSCAADEANFARLLTGLHAVGFLPKVRSQVLSSLAAVLWLGQIRIDAVITAQGEEHAVIVDNEALRVAAVLLGCDPSDLVDGLCIRCIKAGRDWVKSQHTPAQARSVRDGFAQAIHARVFHRVVQQANASLAADFQADSSGSHDACVSPTGRPSVDSSARWSGAATPFVGLLDIFGFEALGINSLEQLCINYANEKLQALFVSLMIERTQELYEAEGVRFDAAAAPEHEVGSIALLESIFCQLTEECVLPRGSDAHMLEKLLRLHEANPLFNPLPGMPATSGSSQHSTGQVATARRRERMESCDTQTFVVAHFAGRVRYGVEGFLQKNRDPLSQDLQVMMQWSSVPLLARIFSVGSGTTTGSKFHSVVERFLASLRALLATMSSVNVHFIRCIKPNDVKQPDVVDPECVAKQVTSSGLVPAIRISRAGFSMNMPRNDFVAMSGPAWERTTGGILRRPADDAQLLLLLEWVGAQPNEFCIGRSRVFLRHGVLDRLERVRYGCLDSFIVTVQAAARRRMAVQAASRRRDKRLHAGLGGDDEEAIKEEAPHPAVDSSRVARGDSFARRVGIRKTLDLADDKEVVRRKASFERKCRTFGAVVKPRCAAGAERRVEGAAVAAELKMGGG